MKVIDEHWKHGKVLNKDMRRSNGQTAEPDKTKWIKVKKATTMKSSNT